MPQTSLFCRPMLLATYSPIVQADLAVHKKKVEEVRDWLTRAVAAGCTAPSPSLVSEPRIGLLTGPPGTSSVCGFLAGIKGNMTSSVCDNGTLFPVRGPHYSMDICFLLLFFPLSLSPFTFSLLNVGDSNDAALLERCWEKRHRQNARGRSWAGDYRMDQPIRTQVRGSLHLSSVLRSSSLLFFREEPNVPFIQSCTDACRVCCIALLGVSIRVSFTLPTFLFVARLQELGY